MDVFQIAFTESLYDMHTFCILHTPASFDWASVAALLGPHRLLALNPDSPIDDTLGERREVQRDSSKDDLQ